MYNTCQTLQNYASAFYKNVGSPCQTYGYRSFERPQDSCLISDEDACNLSSEGVQSGAGATADCCSLDSGKLFLPAVKRFSREAED